LSIKEDKRKNYKEIKKVGDNRVTNKKQTVHTKYLQSGDNNVMEIDDDDPSENENVKSDTFSFNHNR